MSKMAKYKFSKKDTIDAHSHITKFVAPLLRAYRKHSDTGYSTRLMTMQDMMPEGMRVPDTVQDWDELEKYEDLLKAQWVWVLDEIVWTFNTLEVMDKVTISPDEDMRIERGMKLFAAVYLSLWW
jgi:hypothetical protein